MSLFHAKRKRKNHKFLKASLVALAAGSLWMHWKKKRASENTGFQPDEE